MPRGSLIWPFLCDWAALDTASTNEDPDGAGTYTSGYDPIFRETRRLANSTQAGASTRQEIARQCLAQIEPEVMDRLEMFSGGANLERRVVLILHYADLERRGLVDADGEPLIRLGDRLVAIRQNNLAGSLIVTIRNPPGLYVTEVQDRGFGLGTHRNLVKVELRERETGA